MKTLTLFRAYEEAITWQETYLASREKGIDGIAVDKDGLALKWQKYHRLAHKLSLRIECRLGAPLPTHPIRRWDYMTWMAGGWPLVKHFDAWKSTESVLLPDRAK